MACAHWDGAERGCRSPQPLEQLLGLGSQGPAVLGYKAPLTRPAGEDFLGFEQPARRRGQGMEPRQPSRASFSSQSALALVSRQENLARLHSFDSFLQQQAQRWEIGDRLRDGELCLRAETRLPDSFHNLIYV